MMACGLSPQSGEEVLIDKSSFLRLQQASGHVEAGKNEKI